MGRDEMAQAFKDSAFRVETNKWKKGDEVVDGTERRTFTFLAESKDDKELWLYQIRYACLALALVHMLPLLFLLLFLFFCVFGTIKFFYHAEISVQDELAMIPELLLDHPVL